MKPLLAVFGCLVYGTVHRGYSGRMELQGDRVEISLRLLTNGRYTWVITAQADRTAAPSLPDFLRSIDQQLKDIFPNHVSVGTGRVGRISDEE